MWIARDNRREALVLAWDAQFPELLALVGGFRGLAVASVGAADADVDALAWGLSFGSVFRRWREAGLDEVDAEAVMTPGEEAQRVSPRAGWPSMGDARCRE